MSRSVFPGPTAPEKTEIKSLVVRVEAVRVRDFFAHLERKKYKLHVRVFLSRYRGYTLCTECNGARLRSEARHVKIAGKNICDVVGFTVEEAAKFFSGLELSAYEQEIAGQILVEIRNRLKFLNEVGL